MKPAIRSALAAADIESALDFYLAEAPAAAGGFIDALERATRQIETHPGSGSPRYALDLNIPQLRFLPLQRYPYALFYVEHDEHLYVIRCVHMSRDLPATLREEPR
ncbi:MAG: type II toxin-antitoxin system RelE/ParE family toxin [Holophagales bacterium]|nr:MAG: type II toxin-antitoxin system RelE/ParE family toxin [Holophagales bacterium]